MIQNICTELSQFVQQHRKVTLSFKNLVLCVIMDDLH